MSTLADNGACGLQFGALPYRFASGGGLQILLITSRTTRRWIIPKGWAIKGSKPWESAAREAYEEAGLRGTVARRPFGSYLYVKTFEDGAEALPCEVRVFPLLV